MAGLASWGMLGAVGAVAFWLALGFGWGSGPRIGSAHLPLLLSGLLTAVAAWGLVDTWRRQIGGTAVQWRPLIAISAAVVFFAATVERLGLVPAVLVSMVIAYLGQSERDHARFVVFAAGFAALVWLIFAKGLGLPMRAFGG